MRSHKLVKRIGSSPRDDWVKEITQSREQIRQLMDNKLKGVSGT